MKLFNSRKQKDEPTKEQHGHLHQNVVVMVGDGSRGLPENDDDNYNTSYAAHLQALREQTLEHERRLEQDYQNRRGGLGGWIKTLKCTSHKNSSSGLHSLYPDGVKSARNPSKRQVSWDMDATGRSVESSQPNPRPVVITIREGKDGGIAQRWQPPVTTSVGPPERAGQRAPRKQSSLFNVFKRSSSGNNKQDLKYAKEMEDLMTHDEIARRLRWQQNLEGKKTLREDGELPALFRPIDEESLRTGCQSTCTGVDTFSTGFTNLSGFSKGTGEGSVLSTDDYTTDYTYTKDLNKIGLSTVGGYVSGGYTTEETEDNSDESEDTYRNRLSSAPSSRLPNDHPSSFSDDEPIISSPRRRTSRHSSGCRGGLPQNSLLPGLSEQLTEDLGIIAGLLISDGAACLGGIRDVTKESITSCRGEDRSTSLHM